MKTALFISTLLASASGGVLAMAQSAPSTSAPSTSAPSTGPASAEASSGTLQEVVVTAQRRSESLQRVPIAVTALGAKALETRGIESLTGLSENVQPGLEVQPYAGVETTLTFNIRGVSAADPVTGLNDAGVAVYTDGVPIGRAVGAGVDLGDIQQIEVLRGPQGTLFGRNAEGGAVQFITTRPTGRFGGSLDGEYGNYNEGRVLGSLNLPSFANFSVKISGLYNTHDGYTKNAPLGPLDSLSSDDHHSLGLLDEKGYRVAALWKPLDNLDIYYTYDHTHTDFTPSYTVRTGGRTPSEPAFCQVQAFAALCADPATLAANIYQNTQPAQPGRPDTSVAPIYAPLSTDAVSGHALIATWSPSNAIQLKSITGYRTLDERSDNAIGPALAFVQFVPTSYFGFLPPGTTDAVSGTVPTAQIGQSQFSQELQVLAHTRQFQLTAGLFYFKETVLDTRDSLFTMPYIYTGTPGFLTPLTTDPFPLQTSPVSGLSTSLQTYHAESHSYAAYGQGTYSPDALGNRAHITLGVRYTDDKKVFDRLVFEGLPDSGPGSTSEFKATRFDPAAILAYDFASNFNVYAKYSSAYRPGGVNIRDKLALSPYQAEVNRSYEVGYKSQFFDNRVRWNVAGFDSIVSDMQISEPDDPADPSSQKTINSPGHVTFRGVESEITYSPTRGLVFGVSYAYLNSSGPKIITTPAGPFDFEIPYAPKDELSLTGDYTIPLPKDLDVALHGDYNYISNNTGTPLQAIPDFAQAANQSLHNANFRVALENIKIPGATLMAAFWIHNAFNSDDYAFAFETGTADFTVTQPGGAANFVPPRTYGLEVKAVF